MTRRILTYRHTTINNSLKNIIKILSMILSLTMISFILIKTLIQRKSLTIKKLTVIKIKIPLQIIQALMNVR